MQYIKIPIEDLNLVSQETLDKNNLVPRISTDGKWSLMKCQHFAIILPEKLIMTLAEDGETEAIVYPYPVYEGDSLQELLSSPEWSATEDQPSVLSSTNILDTPVSETKTTRAKKTNKSTIL